LFRRAAETGDPEALEALVRRLEPMLISEVAAQMGARLRKMFEVDDMTQSVLLSFIKDLREKKFDWRGSASLRANLILRVINKIRQRARHQNAKKRNPGSLVSLQDSAIAAVGEPAWEDRAWLEEEDELQSAISELLTHYRGKSTTVKYILLSISGHSSAEIEQLLGVTSRRIRQIEEELRQHVQKRWNEA
jgi:RNA polymerase sigma factor (sigma-70 family)